jgi:hypothetical protein
MRALLAELVWPPALYAQGRGAQRIDLFEAAHDWLPP